MRPENKNRAPVFPVPHVSSAPFPPSVVPLRNASLFRRRSHASYSTHVRQAPGVLCALFSARRFYPVPMQPAKAVSIKPFFVCPRAACAFRRLSSHSSRYCPAVGAGDVRNISSPASATAAPFSAAPCPCSLNLRPRSPPPQRTAPPVDQIAPTAD